MEAKQITAEYVPGIGWMYVIRSGAVLLGRRGNFETEEAALVAGRAFIARTA
jgi:hypothetical protein